MKRTNKDIGGGGDGIIDGDLRKTCIVVVVTVESQFSRTGKDIDGGSRR